MKKIKRLLLVTLLTFSCGTTFSQTIDSLSVFPNPFATSTTIHFDIVQSDTITLRVFNPLGQTVRTFFQSTVLPSGSYNINFVGDSLADGIYFVRLDIGSTKSLIKKAIKSGSTAIIENNKVIDKIFIYPNPTNDLITIPISGNKTINVTDLNGKIIKTVTTDQQVISLLDLSAGQYFITILTNQNEIITTQKILKSE
ncbi:MAG TPA: T9SS type A sorting domain-containing protein [Saprospiraceae bacterium]|nr:T9SS type A sorting domain-containing protein [Flavobacterium piscis]HNI79420.1 T9SS type A sorting domain-containing protein [Saprospiraceae bacterium]